MLHALQTNTQLACFHPMPPFEDLLPQATPVNWLRVCLHQPSLADFKEPVALACVKATIASGISKSGTVLPLRFN